MSEAPGTKRSPWIGLGLLLVLAGGGRLVFDELRLVEQTTQLTALEERAQGQDALQKDLGQTEDKLAMLRAELRQARRRVEEADRRVVDAEAALRRSTQSGQSAAGDLQSAQDALKAARSEAASAKQARGRLEKRLDEVEALAAREARRAEVAEKRAAAKAAAAKAAQAEAAAAQREAAAKAAALKRAEGVLTETRAQLARARSRAAASEGTLKKLRTAGVNVDRLSGKRPMPEIQAIVVQVDKGTTPPSVLVNAGKVNGLEPKDVLHVIRGGREIARLEVDEVNDYLSTTRVVWSVRGVTLRPSDAVRSHSPKSP